MSLLINQPPKLCFGKPVVVRSSPLHSLAFSSSCFPKTLPYAIVCADPCRPHLLKVVVRSKDGDMAPSEERAPVDLMERMEMIGTSNGWLATLSFGLLELREQPTPCLKFSDSNYEVLPPFETLPLCQTEMVTNVAMSSSSPEEEDCVVAVKFLGPQLSFCRSAHAEESSDWINVRIANPCFFSSRVTFSKKYDLFRIPGSGGHLIGSWDPREPKHTPQIRRFRFENVPKMTETKRELLDSCYTSEHLVESRSTNETFMVKWYKKTVAKTIERMETEALMVFTLFKEEEEGNAVYTQDIGDLVILLTKSETFCVPASSFPHMRPNHVKIFDVDETTIVNLAAQNWNC